MSWTDERIDQLKAMWEKGLTASQIAEELGGVSRNAVIGKAHRLGLQSRPSPVKANEAPKKAAPVRKPAPVAETEAPKPAPIQHSTPAPVRHPAPVTVAAISPSASAPAADAPPPAPQPRIISVGPGGFLRQGPNRNDARVRGGGRGISCGSGG
ncbi:GcrA cell cycle regulator [Sphingobium herbicidovorans NBRC 16415]|uniref:GcrA cell cycle regulator n=1 Tax=Sphingobium herbicidovorans (strain ATCC 700291 / DSM 11019 / CCUG 56400 / KCTC 2939 / LMG 18315 / NBRC 16415 / MH) TaxID=1219045 RepID=A0A086P856_SPHHM|nr:GcrA cell cycle regulator [Sphingobium herbicidovorans NBRC 16415]